MERHVRRSSRIVPGAHLALSIEDFIVSGATIRYLQKCSGVLISARAGDKVISRVTTRAISAIPLPVIVCDFVHLFPPLQATVSGVPCAVTSHATIYRSVAEPKIPPERIMNIGRNHCSTATSRKCSIILVREQTNLSSQLIDNTN